jgi:hypothetical protein
MAAGLVVGRSGTLRQRRHHGRQRVGGEQNREEICGLWFVCSNPFPITKKTMLHWEDLNTQVGGHWVKL